MSKKSEKVETKSKKDAKSKAIALLCEELKIDAQQVEKLIALEKELRALKVAKDAKKQKVVRQKMRNLHYYRSDATSAKDAINLLCAAN